MANRTKELEDLVGPHILTGVDTSVEKVPDYGDTLQDAEQIRFILDGVAYTATQDPNDGYRSSMSELSVGGEVKNVFPPHNVIGAMRANEQYEEHDVIDFTDAVTGKIVLSVGTGNTDDYYPYWVGAFTPENLAINAEVKS